MQAKLFAKAYRCLVHFYGVINEQDAFCVLKSYYPTLRKSEFLQDLKERSRRRTRGYAIVDLGRARHFLIAMDNLNEEELLHALQGVEEMEVKILPYLEFLSYERDLCPNPPAEYRELQVYILKRMNPEMWQYIPPDSLIASIWHRLRFHGYESVSQDLMGEQVLNLKGKQERNEFANLLLRAHNVTPMPSLKGNNALEFSAKIKQEGSLLLDEALKESIQGFVQDGLTSIGQLREYVLQSPDLSEELREQFLKELDELQEETPGGEA